MKKRSLKWWIVLALLSPGALWLVYNIGGIFIYLPAKAMIARHKILSTDRPALLSACRQMLADRDKYRNDWVNGYLRKGDKAIDADVGGITPDVPEVIRRMNPRYVVIEGDHVRVMVHAPPRAGFIGFAERAKQYGDLQLTNGLWYIH